LNEENAQFNHKSITIQLLNLRATNKIAKFKVPIKDQDELRHWYYFDMSKSLNAKELEETMQVRTQVIH
jgi:hypothetical protein